VLPDHLHTIWTMPEGDADFAVRWALIKAASLERCVKASGFSQRRRRRERGIWQRRYWSTRSATKTISRGTSITFILIQSSTAMWHAWGLAVLVLSIEWCGLLLPRELGRRPHGSGKRLRRAFICGLDPEFVGWAERSEAHRLQQPTRGYEWASRCSAHPTS